MKFRVYPRCFAAPSEEIVAGCVAGYIFMRISNSLFSCLLLSSLLVFGNPALAQGNFHHFTANVGGGFTAVTGDISNRLDNGGHFQGGAGYNLNRFLSIGGTFSYHALGVTRSALQAAQQPDGNGRVYTFTVNPKLTYPLGFGNFYVLAGGGWLRRTVEFTRPTIASTVIFDPFFGFFRPVLVPANQILGSVSQNAGVWDVGGGMNFDLPRTRAKLFWEVRFYSGLTSGQHTTLVPITVGLRW